MSTPRLIVEPADALVDMARSIRAEDLPPGPAQLSATLLHPDGSRWQSQATFLIGPDGGLDLDIHPPLAGDWDAPDAMNAVTAMRRISPPREGAQAETTDPLHIDLRLQTATACLRAGLVQRFALPEVRCEALRNTPFSGALYHPPGAGPHPAVVVFNGSGGGVAHQRAAVLAAHGYLALALGYFKSPGRPEAISETPLEYFEAALQWLHRSHRPRGGFVALTGQSRGAELSLLLGARFAPLVSAVAAYVPSSVLHGTLRAGRPGQAPDGVAWTWQGEPLPHVWQDNPLADWSAYRARPGGCVPVRQAPSFVSAHRHAPSVAAARIPVEQIRGPVLLVSGGDDGFWPSALYADEVAASLARHGHPWPVMHLRADGAGHAIGLPYLPATLIARPHPVAGVVLDGGGSARANARASRRAWQALLRFLSEASA